MEKGKGEEKKGALLSSSSSKEGKRRKIPLPALSIPQVHPVAAALREEKGKKKRGRLDNC